MRSLAEMCIRDSMGTGPYMFDRVEGDTYTFIRNPYYGGEAPEVDECKVKVIPDNAAKILALRNGEIDAILGSSRLSAEGYTAISQDAAFGPVSYTHLDVYKRQVLYSECRPDPFCPEWKSCGTGNPQ